MIGVCLKRYQDEIITQCSVQLLLVLQNLCFTQCYDVKIMTAALRCWRHIVKDVNSWLNVKSPALRYISIQLLKCNNRLRHVTMILYWVVQKSDTPFLILRKLPQMYADFNHFFSLLEQEFMTHKSKIMPATSPLLCNHTT